MVISPVTKYLIAASIVVGVLLAAYLKGASDVHAEWDLVVQKEQIIRLKKSAASEKVNTVVVTKYVDRIVTIEKEAVVVKEYIDRVVPSGFAPTGLVKAHDASVRGTVPVQSDIGDSTVPFKTVANVINDNYATCRKHIEQVEAWRNWYREQCKIMECEK